MTPFYCSVPVTFQAAAGKINNGFDPPVPGRASDPKGEPAWVSVIKGQSTDVTKLVIPEAPDQLELKVIQEGDDADPNELEVRWGSNQSNSEPFSKGDNPLTITSSSTSTEITTHTIAIAVKSTQQGVPSTQPSVAKLKVMVLPMRTVSLGIYRIQAPGSPNQSVDGPTDRAIRDKLSEIYKQAGIQFQIVGTSSPSLDQVGTFNISYDTYSLGAVVAGDGRVQREEWSTIVGDSRTQAGSMRLFLAANSGSAGNTSDPFDQWIYARGETDTVNGKTISFVFTKTGHNNDLIVELNSGHELGHGFGLTAIPRSPITQGADEKHDYGPFPPETATTFQGLMHPGQAIDQPGLWMPHEDWRSANTAAVDFVP